MSRRISMVTTELRPGGAEKCLTQLAEGLIERGWQVHVISLKIPPEKRLRHLVNRLRAAGASINCLNVRSRWKFAQAIKRTRALIQEFRPDVVQSFLYHANVVAGVATTKTNIPHFAGLRVAQRERRRVWIERWACRRTRKFVCVSRGVAKVAQQFGRLPAEKLVVIPNSIDVSSYVEASPIELTGAGLPEGRRFLLFVGRLEVQKSLDQLIHAAAICLPQLPDHDVVIAGEGTQRMNLCRLARRIDLERGLNIENRLHFIGWQPSVPSLMQMADLFVFPSSYEGMANVLLEAMASRLPIVATDVEGCRELFGDDAEPQLVSRGDPGELAERIVELIGDERRRTQLGQANHARVAEYFTVDALVNAYQNMYAKAIDC